MRLTNLFRAKVHDKAIFRDGQWIMPKAAKPTLAGRPKPAPQSVGFYTPIDIPPPGKK